MFTYGAQHSLQRGSGNSFALSMRRIRSCRICLMVILSVFRWRGIQSKLKTLDWSKTWWTCCIWDLFLKHGRKNQHPSWGSQAKAGLNGLLTAPGFPWRASCARPLHSKPTRGCCNFTWRLESSLIEKLHSLRLWTFSNNWRSLLVQLVNDPVWIKSKLLNVARTEGTNECV